MCNTLICLLVLVNSSIVKIGVAIFELSVSSNSFSIIRSTSFLIGFNLFSIRLEYLVLR